MTMPSAFGSSDIITAILADVGIGGLNSWHARARSDALGVIPCQTSVPYPPDREAAHAGGPPGHSGGPVPHCRYCGWHSMVRHRNPRDLDALAPGAAWASRTPASAAECCR